MFFFAFGPFAFGWGGRHKRGSGRIVSRERAVGEFHGIRLEGMGAAYVTQGPAHAVRVEADDNIVDNVTTTVRDGLLVVDLKGGTYSLVTVRVHVSSPVIDTVWISGQGKVVTASPLKGAELLCKISGSGSVDLSGSVVTQTVHLSGMGSVQNSRLSSSRCSVKLSGMGDCRVNVSEELDARVSGVGRVTYRGTPVVRKKVSGFGSVRAE